MAVKIKEIILGIAIAVIFIFFVVFGIKAFYKEPKYEDFCARGTQLDIVSGKMGYYYSEPYPMRVKEPDQNACAKSYVEYDKFRKSCAEKNMDVVFSYDQNGCQIAKECTACNVNYDMARNIYFRNVFIISGIIGIITIIIGALLHIPSVSAGLFGGGVLTIIYGTTSYWSDLADWARFIVLGIALAVLIFIGYKGFAMFGFGKKR